MYNMSGSASAKFRRDRLEASQPNHRKLSESNAVACARPQSMAVQNNNNKYEEVNQNQGQINNVNNVNSVNSVNKTDNDLRALGAMPPVTILKLHEQRLNLNATLLTQLTKQVEDYQKKPISSIVPNANNNNNNNNNNNTHSSNELSLTSRIAELEQKMSQLLQHTTISTPVVGVPEVSKQQFEALSLKCTNMEGQLYTLMTTMHSLNDTRCSNQTNQTKQTGAELVVEQEKLEKLEKRKDLLHSLIATQRDLVSDMSVLVKTFSNSQKPCSCEHTINNTTQPDIICSLNTPPITSSLSTVLPLLDVLPVTDVISVLPATDLVSVDSICSVIPKIVPLTGFIYTNINIDGGLSCDLPNVISDVISDVMSEGMSDDVTNDVAEQSLLQEKLDTINVVSLPVGNTSSNTSESTVDSKVVSKVDSKVDIQKLNIQQQKTGRKHKRTIVSI